MSNYKIKETVYTGRIASSMPVPEQHLAKMVIERALEDLDEDTRRFKGRKSEGDCTGDVIDAIRFFLSKDALLWCSIAGFEYKVIRQWAIDKRLEKMQKYKGTLVLR